MKDLEKGPKIEEILIFNLLSFCFLFFSPDPNSVSLGGMSTESFQGCIIDLSINGVNRDLGEYIERSGISIGCPIKPIKPMS